MEKRKIKVLGMADTRTKKKGTKKVHSDYVYIWSGVDQKEYAKHGVGITSCYTQKLQRTC